MSYTFYSQTALGLQDVLDAKRRELDTLQQTILGLQEMLDVKRHELDSLRPDIEYILKCMDTPDYKDDLAREREVEFASRAVGKPVRVVIHGKGGRSNAEVVTRDAIKLVSSRLQKGRWWWVAIDGELECVPECDIFE